MTLPWNVHEQSIFAWSAESDIEQKDRITTESVNEQESAEHTTLQNDIHGFTTGIGNKILYMWFLLCFFFIWLILSEQRFYVHSLTFSFCFCSVWCACKFVKIKIFLFAHLNRKCTFIECLWNIFPVKRKKI